MLDTLILLVPILLADVVNPVLFAFMVYAVGTDRPLGNSLAALLGHTLSYLCFGILLAVSLDPIIQRLENPLPVDFGISFAIGVLLVWMAWRSATGKGQSEEKRPERLTVPKAFAFGAVINLIGLPFALPYFAALDQIIKADLPVTGSLTLIAAYNLFYALPFLIVPVLAGLMGEASRPILARINEKVDKFSGVLMPVMLALVGVALIADALRYLFVGEGFF
jgi:threonine/homoserine/homoserine lactone efflux protein